MHVQMPVFSLHSCYLTILLRVMIEPALFAMALVLLVACNPGNTASPVTSTVPILLPTTTSTPTIVWFPSTATFTPLPSPTFSLTPTIDVRPKYGSLIFSEDFANASGWDLGEYDDGNIALGKNEISLGVSQPQGYVFSLLADQEFGDFYLEIRASPSICRAQDQYGLLVRVSAQMDFFRFGLNCRGEARLDRLLGDTASSPHAPFLSGAVPPGAPSTTRLGVWASAGELRFYANGEYLFSVHDSSLLSGQIGVFARAGGEEAMSVNFSDLKIYEPLQ